MSIKPVQNQFNGGEISPYMDGRFDLPAYQYSAEIMMNFIPISEGCFKRRGGSHFVSSAKQVDAFLFEIKPIPEDAKVIINGIERKKCYCAYGDEISYSVLADNYQTKSGRTVVYDNTEINITLVSAITFYDFSINAMPEGSTVMINGAERTSIKLGANSTVNWVVGNEGYITQSGTEVLAKDTALDIVLKMRFEIKPYPENATVTINGEVRNFIDVDQGEEVTWSVEYPGLETKSGSQIVENSTEVLVNLSRYEKGQVLFESTNPQTTNFTISETIDANVFVVAGGGGAAGWNPKSVGGGSGSGYIGRIIIPAGTYSIAVGAGAGGRNIDSDGSTLTAGTGGQSKIGDLVITYGGAGGCVGRDHFQGGEGGGMPTVNASIVTTNLRVAGNAGSRIYSGSAPGGNSVYGGYGTGGSAVSGSGKSGTSGYVKIVFLGVA
jgi:hypothetical protein